MNNTNNQNNIVSLADAFPTEPSKPVNGGTAPREVPPPLPLPATSAGSGVSLNGTVKGPRVQQPTPAAGRLCVLDEDRRPSIEGQIDQFVERYATRLASWLRVQNLGETLLATLAIGTLCLSIFILLSLSFVLPLPGFLSFGIALAVLIVGTRIGLRASTRHLNALARRRGEGANHN